MSVQEFTENENKADEGQRPLAMETDETSASTSTERGEKQQLVLLKQENNRLRFIAWRLQRISKHADKMKPEEFEEELYKENVELGKENKRLNARLKQLQQQIKSKDDEIKNFQESQKIFENDIEEQHRSLERQIEELTESNKMLSAGQKVAEEQNSQNEDAIRQLEAIITQHQDSMANYKMQIGQYEQNFIESKRKTASLEKDKRDLTLRLSKLAGANLTYNNPKIADLSDENRPTKLAEDFSELYDNEWTDAFEALTIEGEREKTLFMLSILKKANMLCHNTTKDHIEAVRKGFTTLNIRNDLEELVTTPVKGTPAVTKKESQNDQEIEERSQKAVQSSYDNTATDETPPKPEDEKKTKDKDQPEKQKDADADRVLLENKGKSEENNEDRIGGQLEHPGKTPTATDDIQHAGNKEKDNLAVDKNQPAKGKEEQKSPVNVDNTSTELNTVDGHADQQDTNERLYNKVDNKEESKELNKLSGQGIPVPCHTSLQADFEVLTNEQKKTVSEIRRFFDDQLSDRFHETSIKLITRSLPETMQTEESLQAYIQKCLQLCWSMCRHEPPVIIHFIDTISDTLFNTNVYKPYTKTGKYLDYVVWPALYLHEGGPMLSKGIAQGCK